MQSFYSRRSQKHKNYYSQAISLFALLGFALIKAACKKLMKLSPGKAHLLFQAMTSMTMHLVNSYEYSVKIRVKMVLLKAFEFEYNEYILFEAFIVPVQAKTKNL